MEERVAKVTETKNENPIKLPAAWPMDGRTKIVTVLGRGRVIKHPDRAPMLWNGMKWEEIDGLEEARA